MNSASPVATQPTDIAAQAKQLGLGVATIAAADIANSPTNILPLAIIETRRIFPYRFDEATQTVFVAVADGAELKKPAPAELQAQRKLNRKLKLELIDPATFASLLPAIRARFGNQPTAPVSQAKPAIPAPVKQPSLPKVDLRTVSIPRAVFLKIPHDVATKFRVIVFAAPADGTHVNLATDQPHDAGVQRVVSVIKEKRGVTAELYEAEPEPMNAILAAYGTNADPISLVSVPVTKSVPIIAAADATQAKPSLPNQPKPNDVVPPKPLVQPPGSTGPHLGATPPLPPLPVRPSVGGAAPVPVATKNPASTIPVKPAETKPASADVVAKPTTKESMPVDTSPVTKQLPSSPAPKIQLAAPLNSASVAAKFPMPVISPAAQAYAATTTATRLASSTPALFVAQKPAEAPKETVQKPVQPVVVTPMPLKTPQTPTQTSPAALVQPAKMSEQPPLSLKPLATSSESSAQVQQSQIANTSSFASLNVIQSTDDQDLDKTVGSTIKSADELETVVRTGLVPKILAAILQYAVNVGASDIHVEATVDSLRIRFRVDGVLQDVLKAPLGLDAPFVSRVKILSGMKIDEQRIPQDGRFTATSGGREIDFRVSTLPAIHGEKVVMRILDKSVGVRTIDQLGMEGTNLSRVMAAIVKPFGIILVTGPTGSGKTTTLYAMLGTLNKPGVNIITLEDPVEYELIGITQTQVKPKIGFSFAEGLRSVLRQDPDIVMVGEIRDRETASLATHAALTGHLVLSTLHTNNAAGAIPRFLNMGVEPFLVASSIEAIIAQRLVRRLCDTCKQSAPMTDAIQKDITATLGSSVVEDVKKLAAGPFQFFGPHGCEECHDGYRGRLGIYEVMTVSPEIEGLTAKKATLSEIQAIAESQGMVTMKQDGILKVIAGLTSLDEILRVTTSD